MIQTVLDEEERGKKEINKAEYSALDASCRRLRESVPDGPTDGRTYGWTDKPSYRDARTHLKTLTAFLTLVAFISPPKI